MALRVLTSRRTPGWLLLAILAVLATVIALLYWPRPDGVATDAAAPQGMLDNWFARKPLPAVAEASAQAASNVGEAKPFNPLDTMEAPIFRATPQGKLVLDVQTRHDVERMVALFANDNGLQRLDMLSADLPAQARHELRDLYQRYLQYSQALTQAMPQGQGTLEEAFKQFQTMRELRQQYFGPEMAEPMFAAEEATTAELLELMRKQTDPKATLEERAAQAQDLWKKEHPGGQP